jgi:hypothetical protein
MRHLASSLLLPMLALVTACSSQTGEAAAPSTGNASANGDGAPSDTSAGSDGPFGEPSCRTQPDTVCVPDGFPFAVVALGVSDVCGGPQASCPRGLNPPPGSTTMQMTQDEPGKLCLAGVVAPAGYSSFVIVYSLPNAAMNQIVKTFDAEALGITQLAFTIDSPPIGGVGIGGAVDTSSTCPEDYLDCQTSGFALMTGSDSTATMQITAPGRIVAPLSNFKQTRSAPVSQVFDTHAIENLSFGVGEGPYDFCVSDFQFLDAGGQVVQPR